MGDLYSDRRECDDCGEAAIVLVHTLTGVYCRRCLAPYKADTEERTEKISSGRQQKRPVAYRDLF